MGAATRSPAATTRSAPSRFRASARRARFEPPPPLLLGARTARDRRRAARIQRFLLCVARRRLGGQAQLCAIELGGRGLSHAGERAIKDARAAFLTEPLLLAAHDAARGVQVFTPAFVLRR